MEVIIDYSSVLAVSIGCMKTLFCKILATSVQLLLNRSRLISYQKVVGHYFRHYYRRLGDSCGN